MLAGKLPASPFLSKHHIDSDRQIVQAAEAVGFIPDKPFAGSAVDKISILAHNAILFAGEQLRDAVFERIRKHVPQEVMGGEVKGVNARWRVYRTSGSLNSSFQCAE